MVDQIGKHNPCAPACAVNCRSQPFGILAGIMSVQHDVITGPRKSKRDGGADAPARSSDQRRARIFCDVVSHAEQIRAGPCYLRDVRLHCSGRMIPRCIVNEP